MGFTSHDEQPNCSELYSLQREIRSLNGKNEKLVDALHSMLGKFDLPEIPTEKLADGSAIKKARLLLEQYEGEKR